MSTMPPEFNTTLSLAEMEALIRRVVTEAVHEELARLLQRIPPSILEDWACESVRRYRHLDTPTFPPPTPKKSAA